MTERIEITLTTVMEITVPEGRNAEEYIDELLDSVLSDEFRYNAEWDFVP